ncbi:amino acid/polyamine transporter I [Apodospora peruviana]|uniref:Amino acid/polyamine transporter I n=1 Tax=Apodospora peruviana TaxID=516989 RepID=A0AAE0MCP5_9PEZI|nr:amino acid/polyamine transporter I [Apodospora peruviana]
MATAVTAQLVAMGYDAALPRNFTPLSMLGMAFAILNSWGVMSASLPLALASGGPSVAVWGVVFAGIGNLSIAVSLAEFLSAYPTAGGQYHWAALIAPNRHAPLLAWVAGWTTVFGWIAVAGSGSVLTSQMVAGMVAQTENAPHSRASQFVSYLLVTLVAFAVNVLLASQLPSLNKAALYWSILGFIVIPASALLLCKIDFADPSFVFAGFVNKTRWPDAVAWLLGSLQAGLALNGYDAVSHCIEEIPNAAVVGPLVMISCVALGIATSILFIVVILFVSGGYDAIDDIIGSPLGPLMTILSNASGSRVVATVLMLFPLLCLVIEPISGCENLAMLTCAAQQLFGTISIMTTSSRMVFAFARDGGLPRSDLFERIHKSQALPLNALCLAATMTALLGFIFLISTTAFNSIASASVVALSLSYALPIAIHLAQGRSKLPDRPFTISPKLGWVVNIIGVSYTAITTVLFLLPPQLPVRGNMNYAGAVILLVLGTCVAAWYASGRKHYRGPVALRYNEISATAGDGSEEDEEHAD